MKKIFSKILISFLVLGFFFAPVTLNVSTKQIKITERKTFAQSGREIIGDPNTPLIKAVEATRQEPANEYFGCGADPRTWFQGCIVQLFFFLATGLAGAVTVAATILDWFIFYSTNSTAYKSNFIESAWGTVRDIANIFFLLGLIYVAIKISVGSHVSEAKGQIAKIIIMALLVNFSLFATQVVIDASNILARVFYNQVESVDKAGNKLPENSNEPKSISVSLASKFEPQTILNDRSSSDLGIKFLIILITIILFLYIIYLFLSVAFLFLGRIVSLWVSMIFAPIAFMSRGVGAKIPGLSWGEWLSTLISSAFMAPIFIFFLYIVLLLGDSVKLGQISGNLNWLHTIVTAVVPFAMIFVLLMKAKDLAVKYSGDIGKAVNRAGLALTGGALALTGAGLAFGGRNTIGRGMAILSSDKDKRKSLDYAEQKRKYDKAILDKTFTGSWKEYQKKAGLTYNWKDRIGGNINYSQLKTKGIDHAKHELDETKKKAGLEGVDEGRMSAVEKKKFQETFIKEHKSEFETNIRKGNDGKDKIELELYDANNQKIKGIYGENGFKAFKRQKLIEEMHKSPEVGDIEIATGELTDQGKKKIEDKLNQEFNEVLKSNTKIMAEKKFEKLKTEAKETVTIGDRIRAKSTSGSYDIRNLAPDPKAVSGWFGGQKTIVLLLAAIAASLRTGLKKTDINPGMGKGDFFKDISNVISDAIKAAGAGGGGGGGGSHGHDDHGGGHDDHGHGGGGHH